MDFGTDMNRMITGTGFNTLIYKDNLTSLFSVQLVANVHFLQDNDDHNTSHE